MTDLSEALSLARKIRSPVFIASIIAGWLISQILNGNFTLWFKAFFFVYLPLLLLCLLLIEIVHVNPELLVKKQNE